MAEPETPPAETLVRIPLTRFEIRELLKAPPRAEDYVRMTKADAEALVCKYCIEAGQSGRWQHLSRHLIYLGAIIRGVRRTDRGRV